MKKVKKILSLLIMVLFSVFITSCGTSSNFSNEEDISAKVDSNSDLVIHYIDVGQGDSELIQVDGKNILIDAGDNKDDAYYYLKKLGVTTLDYIIATHPHEDHIGGMDKVIDEMNVGTFYAPKITTNTKTFENMVNSLKKKNLQMKAPKVGEEINVGKAKLTFLAPNGDNYKELNDYSIVVKVTYGSNSFLFMGDAEELSESEILKNGLDVSTDVLKVGHHGSNSSTSNNFLKKVSPTYAIISVGKDNKYGHPTDSTLKKLKSKKVFRTDLNGTVRAYSDGKKVYVYSDKKTKEDTKSKKTKN
ncbi:MBL fold metallo-hydrolase [Clostridium sp. SHJSY1]|uniref:ComEC/Rec2 family competence protein n=1 Tax=Clostridium sp. SHJSY1 TaxID=2942483 RepID=UPI00287458B6|nr:MBL fold metallo-hydrolase [Clostridium sp. SHJSY1]MDS0526579.1 MBL fold metallo-hydrolase [Clostridium sp. SHJSY1]